MPTTTKVLVAYDLGTVRKGLQFLPGTDPAIEVVGEAPDGREAVRLTEPLSPDVVVMDITMPYLNGIDAASQIVNIAPPISCCTRTGSASFSYQQAVTSTIS